MASNVILADGQDPAVNHTFTFASQNGLLFSWNDLSGETYEGFNRLTIQMRPASAANQGYRITWKLDVPKLATTAPASGSGYQPNPKAAYVAFAKGEFFIPSAADLPTRKNLMSFVQSLMFKDAIVNAVENLSAPQ